MSIKFVDDPSFYATAQFSQRWSVWSGVPSVSSGIGRFGGNCWRASTNSVGWRQTVSAVATGTIGVSFLINTLPVTGSVQCGPVFYDNGSIQVDLRINSTGTLFVTRNGTQIGSTSTNAIATGVWYRIEFQATIDPSAGSIEVRVNGSSTGWIPPTGSLNTRNTTNSSFNQVGIFVSAGASAPCSWNDFIYTDSNSPNAGFLGDKRCFPLFPSANSSVAWTPTFASFLNNHSYALGETFKDSNGNVQRTTTPGTSASSGTPTWATTGGSTTTSGGATFTVVGSGSNPGATNWMAVSEPAEDGDSSYSADSTPGDIDLFTVVPLPAGAQNIAAIDNVVLCRKDDAGTRTIQNIIKSGGTQAGATNLALSTTYVFDDFINETDPNTSAGWTASGVNAMLIGYKEIA